MAETSFGAAANKFSRKMANMVDGRSMSRVSHAAGREGKRTALEVGSKKLGSDMRMSGFRSRARMGVGYDLAGSEHVDINFRPKGMWKLADEGRKSSGRINPRRRSGRRAVVTPLGPRHHSNYGRSRGLGVLRDSKREMRRTVPRAAHRQFQQEIRTALRG